MEYKEIKQQIVENLSVSREFEDQENLLELGLNSLMIMRLVNQWRKQGVKVLFGDLMEHPTFGEWWELIQRGTKKKRRKTSQDAIYKKDMKKPFPLTDVQYAYWVGRNDDQVLGGIGCHAYLEFDGVGVDAERLEKAWNQLQFHHPMLRVHFLEDGTQEIMDTPYSEKIQVNDFSNRSVGELDASLKNVRKRLSHRKLQTEKGEVAGLELSLLPEDKTRVHIDMDLLVADVQSLQILLRDLASAYIGDALPAESMDWNFAAYLEQQMNEEEEEREKAKKYWTNRLNDLPGGPELPLENKPEEVRCTQFSRRIIKLDKSEWDSLQKRSADYRTTPAMLLLTAYAAVLERWSKNKRFLINIPFFNRKTEYRGIEEVIADFTTLLLLEVNCEGAPTFLNLLERIQKQLHQDMKYTAYSGVQVQRDMAQLYGEQRSIAPVVFACNLGVPLINQTFQKNLGNFSYMISQTPQVWLDFQTYEDESGLMLTWDTVDELFPGQMIQDMIGSFGKLLHTLADADWNKCYDVLPEKQKLFIRNECRIRELKNPRCLHQAFLEWADKTSDALAIVDTGKDKYLTYGEVKKEALTVAAAIIRNGIQGKPIAVTTERGYKQIIAVLGILLSGNCYVPISTNQPYERRKLIYEKTGIKFVVSDCETFEKIKWPEEIEVYLIEEAACDVSSVIYPVISPDSTAYIIMTSGSTGTPKGVEIAHYSAWNTIEDITDKYGICCEDAVLGVSALDFDLSVFDIFGLLGSGGRLILIPEEERNNPEYWALQIEKFNVTVWNTVPILLEMLLASLNDNKLPFKVAFISGDWISLKLPEELKEHAEICRFIAMGGATEGSIWSNYQEIYLPVPSHWKSIPYGRPLKNQAYRVVDHLGRDCPVWVPGELWIGGYGAAKGYRNDIQLTNEKFVEDELGRWYRTGDEGRFWSDSTIEFLGRKDNQVKIRGHRIEIGEIESCLVKKEGIKKAVVVKNDNILQAYVELDRNINAQWLKENEALVSNAIKQAEQIEKIAEHQKVCKGLHGIAELNHAGIYLAVRIIESTKLFAEKNKSYPLSELLKNGGIAEECAGILERVLEVCVDAEIVSQSEHMFSYVNDECRTRHLSFPLIFKQLIDPSIDVYCSVLQGKMTIAELVLDSGYQLSPQKLHMCIHSKEEHEFMKELIGDIISVMEKNASVLEVGSKIYNFTDWILAALGDSKQYTFADSHKSFIDELQIKYGDRINVHKLDLNEEFCIQGIEKQSFTCIVSNNVIHRYKNIDFILRNIYKILKPGGFFLFNEAVSDTYLSTIAAAIYEDGFKRFKDFRKAGGSILLSRDEWIEHLKINGFDLIINTITSENGDEIFIVAQKNVHEKSFDKEELKKQLQKDLPYYMIPEEIIEIDRIPVSVNGKINRKVLQNNTVHKFGTKAPSYEPPQNDLQKAIAKIWEEVLGITGIGINDKLLNLGGDSLKATKIVNQLKNVGFEASLKALYKSETIKEYSNHVKCKFGDFINGSQNNIDCGEI